MRATKFVFAPLALSTIILLGTSTPAAAATIHIEFSGTFSHCLVDFAGPSTCAGTAFSTLEHAEFHGRLEIPGSGVDLEPDDSTRGRYQFDSPAYMSVTTANPLFNFSSATPVQMLVHNCEGVSCAFNEDYVWTWVERGDFDFLFSLYIPHPPLDSDAVPSAQRMTDFYPNFELLTPSADLEITIDQPDSFVSLLTVSYSTVPIQPTIIGMLSALVALAGLDRRKSTSS